MLANEFDIAAFAREILAPSAGFVGFEQIFSIVRSLWYAN